LVFNCPKCTVILVQIFFPVLSKTTGLFLQDHDLSMHWSVSAAIEGVVYH